MLVVILLFYWIVRRAFEIGRQALALDRVFAGLVAKGVGLWIGAQTFINMGVNLGLLPTKGLTLPLVSFGGSGILLNCISIALLLRVDYENRVLMRGRQGMTPARTLMVMAGGTGGHVFPGLAVAHRMQRLGWRVVWLGNPGGMEATLVPKHGIPIEFVRFGGVRGKGWMTRLRLPLNLLRACLQSLGVFAPDPARCRARHGRLYHVPRGRHGGADRPAARAARTEFDRGPREPRAREVRAARARRVSRRAAGRRVDRQPDSR